jgi:hypothetical protein
MSTAGQTQRLNGAKEAPAVCRHRPLHGPFVSARHLVKCLKVPRPELLEACFNGQLDFGMMPGWHAASSLRVNREQAAARWPDQLRNLESKR